MSTMTFFNDDLAQLYDVNTAIFLNKLSYWIKKNKANGRNLHDGRYWTYNSQPALMELFPYWSHQNIKTVISNCVNFGLIVISNYNKKKYDKTSWYALSDLGLMHFPELRPSKDRINVDRLESTDASVRSNRAIPTDTTSITTTSEQSSPPAPTSPAPTPLELVTVFAEELPDSPQPVVHALTKAVDQKTRRSVTEFKKYWKAKTGYELTADKFRQYLHGIKENAPGFLEEYTNKGGKKQKNGMTVILYWENFEKYLNGTLF